MQPVSSVPSLALITRISKAWKASYAGSLCWDLKGPGKREMQGGMESITVCC